MVWKKSTDMISATLQHDVGYLQENLEYLVILLNGRMDPAISALLTWDVAIYKCFYGYIL